MADTLCISTALGIVLGIHALGVHPAFARRGIAQRMVQYAIGTARSGLPRAAA